LEPEPKNLDAWSWSQKCEFRIHSPGSMDVPLAGAQKSKFLICSFLNLYSAPHTTCNSNDASAQRPYV